MKPAPANSASTVQRLTEPAFALVAVLLGLVAGFCALLWPEWSHNPDLSHGFCAPLVFLLLLWESRRNGPPRWLSVNRWRGWAIMGAVTAGFLLFSLAGLLAASVAWTHALVLFVLAASLGCFLLGGLLILADERLRVLPFNWISLTAIFLWLLVAPLPNGTYARVTLALQGGVTSAVLSVLHWSGIPARQHGNLIELVTTTVGIEEACSGIRSLLSCLYAGFFFAAWQVRRPLRRVLLILAAPLLAIGMNFLRSLILTLMVNAGRDIAGFWHDATGYAILGVTAVVLAALALRLETPAAPNPAPAPVADSVRSTHRLFVPFWCGLAVTGALGVFFFASFRPTNNAGKPAPDLAAIVPAQAPGWKVVTPDNLYRFASILQTTHLLERTYLRPDGRGDFTQLSVYVAYWPAGQATVSRVASHTPDACWPGAGWMARPVSDPQALLLVPGFKISPAEHRLFQDAAGGSQHVWFWQIYDGRTINYRDPYSVPALLRLALQYGFRRQGDQFFIRISSNKPWPELAAEPLFQEIVSHLTPLGL